MGKANGAATKQQTKSEKTKQIHFVFEHDKKEIMPLFLFLLRFIAHFKCVEWDCNFQLIFIRFFLFRFVLTSHNVFDSSFFAVQLNHILNMFLPFPKAYEWYKRKKHTLKRRVKSHSWNYRLKSIRMSLYNIDFVCHGRIGQCCRSHIHLF